jgi:hypothetical protein
MLTLVIKGTIERVLAKCTERIYARVKKLKMIFW